MSSTLLPVAVDILLTRRADGSVRVTIRNAVTGVAENITNDTIIFVARDGYAGAALFTKTNIPGGHLSPTAGQTVFTWTRTEVADVVNAAGKKEYRYTIWRKYPVGDEVAWFEGRFLLHPAAAP